MSQNRIKRLGIIHIEKISVVNIKGILNEFFETEGQIKLTFFLCTKINIHIFVILIISTLINDLSI